MKQPVTLVGERLRKARQFRGLSQKQLAEKSGLTEQTINRLETGQMRDPRLSTLSYLAQALDYSVAVFVEGDMMHVDPRDGQGYDFLVKDSR